MSLLAEGLRKVLKEHGIEPGFQGARGTSYRNLAKDLHNNPTQDHPQILTHHGAKLVLEGVRKGRVKYKELGAAVVAEAERIEAVINARHDREVEALVARIEHLTRVTANAGANGAETTAEAEEKKADARAATEGI